MDVVDPDAVASRLEEVHRRIRAAGGDPAAVRVVAVTKGLPYTAVHAAQAIGIVDIGENYAQELVAKIRALHAEAGPATTEALSWHYLGAVQRRKVRQLAPVVDCWQSVTRPEEGEEIARHRPGAAVLVQVDTTGAPRRNGAAVREVPGLVARLRRMDLGLRGLMTVAPRDQDGARACFETVRELADHLELPVASMGMSDDLELAVACGSTMVRIGRALFGSRPGSQLRRAAG